MVMDKCLHSCAHKFRRTVCFHICLRAFHSTHLTLNPFFLKNDKRYKKRFSPSVYADIKDNKIDISICKVYR